MELENNKTHTSSLRKLALIGLIFLIVIVTLLFINGKGIHDGAQFVG